MGLLAGTENTAQASLPARSTEKVELGQATNLTMADLKRTEAWKVMPERFKKLIDDKRPEFGVIPSKYPSKLLSLYMGEQDCEIAIDRTGTGCFVYPKNITKDLLANPLPPKGKIVNPKTGKPWIGNSTAYKNMTPEDKAYEDALLTAANEVVHLVMLNYTDEKAIKKLKNDIIGMVILRPATKPVSNEEAQNLTEDQIKAYNTFGKVVWNQLEKPVFHGLNVYSACSGKTLDFDGVLGNFFPVVTYYDKPMPLKFYERVIKITERHGKRDTIQKAQQGLETLLQEEGLDQSKLADPNTPLTARQASVSYLYQTAMPIFNNILKLKDFEMDSKGLWVVDIPSKDVMGYADQIFKTKTKIVVPRKIIFSGGQGQSNAHE